MNNRQDIVAVLSRIRTAYGVESVYSHFENGHALPYIAYIGAGQETSTADNSIYWKNNQYQAELYFKRKDPALEENIENAFISGGWHYDKSEDIFLEGESVFYIVYQLT